MFFEFNTQEIKGMGEILVNLALIAKFSSFQNYFWCVLHTRWFGVSYIYDDHYAGFRVSNPVHHVANFKRTNK